LSESEAEFDGPDNQVEVKEQIKNKKLRTTTTTTATNAIRLSEIGPRLKLKLIKIEEGVCEGPVLFHELVKGTEEEIKAIRESRKIKRYVK
jgi:ribosome biogenesis protein SSF1/2